MALFNCKRLSLKERKKCRGQILLEGQELKELRHLNKPQSRKRPAPAESRLVVYNLIHQVNREGAYANLRLPSLLDASTLDERDRAFATELSYGTLRMQGKYDSLISAYSDRAIEKIEDPIVDILRMGLHEILSMRTPEHAAVSQNVDLAKFIVGESSGAFVNAILRSALRDDGQRNYPDNLTRLSIEYSHPQWIVQAFFDLTQDWDRVESILICDNEAAAPNLVAWPGESTVDELLG